MSTDNKTPSAVWAEQESAKEMQGFYKTLADVQPGGMVRLGGQAERARFEAWPQSREFEIQKDGSGEYLSEVTHGAWLAWKYLSAQPSPGETLPSEMRLGSPDYMDYLDTEPSPGGQGDARAQFEAWAESAGWYAVACRPDRDAPYALNAVEFAWQAFQAALAARQPVVTAEMLAAADAYHDSDEYRSGQFSDSHTNAACYRAMAAVAPPAQAVDLGQFRPFVEAQRAEYISHGLTEEDYCVAECDDLLALIDSNSNS